MRIRVHRSLILYLLCLAFFSSCADCVGLLSALLVHELGHYVAARFTGEKIAQLELTPFGGVMRCKPGSVSSKGVKGLLVHAAGPVGNYALLFVFSMPAIQQLLDAVFLRSIIAANLSMLMLNLLPALPLDGGQIVFCIGYYLFPIARLTGFLYALGAAAGGSGILLCLYGLFSYHTVNCSLLIVSLYLIAIASQSHKTLLSENIYAVIQERLTDIPRIRKIVHYHAAPDTALFELIPLLKPDIGVEISFSKETQVYTLTETAFCHGLLSMPSETLYEAWFRFSQNKEKKPVKA